MTHALYVIILVSSPFVVFFLGDGLVRLAGAFGDALRPVPSCFRTEPASRLGHPVSVTIVGGQ